MAHSLRDQILHETRRNYYWIVMASYSVGCDLSDYGMILSEVLRMKSRRLTPDDIPLRRTVPITPPRFNTDVDRTKVRHPGKVGAAQDGVITYDDTQESFIESQTEIPGL